MEFELAYAKSKQAVEIPDANLLSVLRPKELTAGLSGRAEVERAIKEPIGSGPLSSIVRPGERVCIITSDITRPFPSKTVLPPLLDELCAIGVKHEDITVVFALGSHRAHTEAEMRTLVGDGIFESVRCIDHDPKRCVHLGVTSFGTPVDIFEEVVNADKRILLGNIEYHYFAGYSGGAKAIMPGVSTRSAIQANHSRMVDEINAAGRLDGNEVRMDIEEAIRFISADFILNVVLDEKKQILKAVAGDYIKAHREGCKFLDALYKAPIAEKADVVLVSPGGFPKDINLYQAQKALDNAKHAVKPGGAIILVGSCTEGLGESVFEEWMTSARTSRELIDRIARDFQLGGHKAAAIAMVMQNASVALVSDLPADFVERLFFIPRATAQDALNAALKECPEAKVIVMPYGGSTLPAREYLKEGMALNFDRAAVEVLAAKIRLETLKALCALGFGHVGGAMSVVELLATLYGGVLDVDPKNPRKPDRDWLVCSKGHAGPSLYAALALRGYFDIHQLLTLNTPGTNFPSHCDRNKTIGVDMTTGSLGQGMSTAIGVALGHRLDGRENYVYLVLGDGECDEGQVWEGALFAAHFKLDHLIAFVDCNKQQLDGYTDSVMALGDIAAKFNEFGWSAQSVDGHDVGAISDAVQKAKGVPGKPHMIVLNTVKGKGCSFAEGLEFNHHMVIKREDGEEAIRQAKAALERAEHYV